VSLVVGHSYPLRRSEVAGDTSGPPKANEILLVGLIWTPLF
jgi:hypothetical protein